MIDTLTREQTQLLLMDEIPMKSQQGLYQYKSVLNPPNGPLEFVTLDMENNSVTLRLKQPKGIE